jgi:fermentation-respiration switch protein FrsA (DUF1100 family)
MHNAIDESVAFESRGVKLAGKLYVPLGREVPSPAVVVAGTWTSVKEQMATRYAELLAEQGLAALAFDFLGFGESAGTPRDVESPHAKSEDVHAAITYLSSRPDVDPGRIGCLGICAGAGYMVTNAVKDGRVKSLALVAPWLHNAQIVREVYGGDAGVVERMKRARASRLSYELSGDVEYVPAQSTTDPDAAMPIALDFYSNPKRGAVPQWPNRFATMAWLDWLTFDPIRYGRDLAIPLQIVHSETAATPDGVRQFYDSVPGEKDILWTDGEQTDFYDQTPQVSVAVEAVTQHFSRTLGNN